MTLSLTPYNTLILYCYAMLLGVGDILVDTINRQKFVNWWTFWTIVSIVATLGIAVLRGHENVSFAHVFKHCGLKTSDFKPLKCNQQRKRTHFAIYARAV